MKENSPFGMFISISFKPKKQKDTIKFRFFDSDSTLLCTPNIELYDPIFETNSRSEAKRKDEIYNRYLLKRILRKTGFSKEDKDTLIRLYSTNGLNENNIYYTFDTATIKSCENDFYSLIKAGLNPEDSLIEAIKHIKTVYADTPTLRISYDAYIELPDNIKYLYLRKVANRPSSYQNVIRYLLHFITRYADNLDEIDVHLNISNTETLNEIWLYFTKENNKYKAYSKTYLKNTNPELSSSNTIHLADVDDDFLKLFENIPYINSLNNEFDDEVLHDLKKNSKIQYDLVLNDEMKSKQAEILSKAGDILIGLSTEQLSDEENKILQMPENYILSDKTYHGWTLNKLRNYYIDKTTYNVNTSKFDVSRLNKPLNENKINHEHINTLLQTLLDKIYNADV